MSEEQELSEEERDRILWRLWKRRQLNSVVLLAILIGLYFLASSRGLERIAQITFYCLLALPVFAGLIAWWDRHWLWKHQEQMLRILGRTKRS